nr:superoxide dismutase [Frisingicoccus sp.]
MKQTYPFDLMPLPYDYDALEPYMDAETLHYHHDKHLKTYVDNLNTLLKDQPLYQSWTLEELLTRLDELPEELRQPVMNNAGGVYNHQLFFETMHTPVNENPMEPYLQKAFGSYENFVKSMSDHALSQFGSGYAWLVINPDHQLEILNTPNQNNPISNGNIPLLCVDVWEHAYYLKYKNLRKDYVTNWFHLINWQEVYRKAQK